ncbi:uncharacterized protein TNCV_4561851 [Trichonephila clavipes]|nr:uncharacterized protein TNCV_4561851 [Trichonephila clavipes]
MESAVIAAFFHCCSSKHQPKHGQCPVGDESWCKFQRAKASNIVYQDKSLGLPQNIVNTIKPVYMDLCDRNLLKKMFTRKTQNPNESFNAILWQILPKEVFVEHQTLRLGAYIAVVQFNNGFQGLISILNEMGIVSGYYTIRGQKSSIMSVLQTQNVTHCQQQKPAEENLGPFEKKKKHKKIEEEEGITYKTGEF